MTQHRIWHLVARRLAGEATLDELRELEEALLVDPSLAYQVETYMNYFDARPGSERTDEDKAASWEKARSQLQAAFPGSFESLRPVRRLSRMFLLRAAIVCGLAALIVFFAMQGSNTDDRALQLAVNELKTMPGTRSKVVLPDGTQVWLNSDSYLTYNKDFGQTEREVTLTGEAFFDVFHNPDVPMIVRAGHISIRVKGTAFNVRNYPGTEKVETSLIRGSVELTTTHDPDRIIVLKPSEKITIGNRARPADSTFLQVPAANTPHKALYQVDLLKQSTLVNTIPEIAWVDNKLVFDNEPFTEVIGRMEKWYNVKFSLLNQKLAAKRFSGAFEKESVEEALTALQIINYFDFKIQGNQIIIQ